MKSTMLFRSGVLLFLIFVITTVGLNAVPSPDGWEQFGLEYWVESMTVSGDGYHEPVTYEFSMEGLLLSETSASASYTYQYENDDDWNISKMIRYSNDGPVQETRFEYNAKGQLVKAIVYSMPDEDLPREEYVFDASGRLSEMRFLTFMKANNVTAKYSYNAAGQMTRSDEWMGDGSYVGWTTYSYDGHGNVSEEKSYVNNTDPPSVINYKYRYDDSGNIIRRERSGDVDPGVTTYSYRYYEVIDGGD